MSPTEPLWTWREVAAYLRASRSWVYKAAEANTLPSLRIGGLLRFDPAAVRAFARGELAPVLASPVAAFVRERCILRPSAEVRRTALFDEWRRWCEQNGQSRPGTDAAFGRDLNAALPSQIAERRPRIGDERPWFYTGIGLVQAGHQDQALYTGNSETNDSDANRKYSSECNGRSHGPTWTAAHDASHDGQEVFDL